MSLAACAHLSALVPNTVRGDRWAVLWALADSCPAIGVPAAVPVSVLAATSRLDVGTVVEVVEKLDADGWINWSPGEDGEDLADGTIVYRIPGEPPAPKTKARKPTKTAADYPEAAIGFVRWFAALAQRYEFRNVSGAFAPTAADAAARLLTAEGRDRLKAVAQFALLDQRFWGGKVLSLAKLDAKWDSLVRDWERIGSPVYDPERRSYES